VDQDELLELGLLAKGVEIFDNSSSSLRCSVGESELGLLQRRAMSLTFTHNETDRSSKPRTANATMTSNQSIPYSLPGNGDNSSQRSSTSSLGSKSRVTSLSSLSTPGSKSPKLECSTGENVNPERVDINVNFGHDYSASEISFNMEGRVNGGTVAALVERLTLHDQPIGKCSFCLINR
jgi:hypothetical protein